MTKEMDKKEDLVKKYKLEEAVKKFQKINEYTFYSPTMVEDDQDQGGDDMQSMDAPQGGDPNAMGAVCLKETHKVSRCLLKMVWVKVKNKWIWDKKPQWGWW